MLSTGSFPDIKHLNGTDGRRFEYKAFNAFEQTLEEHGEIIDNAEWRDNDVGIGQDPYSSGTKPRENLSQTPKDVSVTTKALLEQDDYVRSEEVEQLIKKAAKAFLKLQK